MSLAVEPRSVGSEAQRATRRDWAALATLMLPVLLVSIDGTVVNLALPTISLDLGTSGTMLLWIIDVYALVLAGLLVTMGSLADRFGRRRLLMLGSFGFAVMSVVAALSTSGAGLVAARAGLGLFGAMLMPSTLSIIRNIFVNRSQRRLALAIWASCFSVGAALGPLVAGVLLEFFTWHAAFLIALPILAPMLILTPLLVPESRDPNPGKISILNVALSILTLAPLVYSIKTFATEGAVPSAWIAMAIFLPAAIWFVSRQLRSANPMLDLRLFRSPAFAGSVLTNLLSIFALAGFLYFAAQHLQLVLGLPPLQAGLVMLPGSILMVISGLGVVPLARRFPVHVLVAGGVFITGVAYVVLAFVGRDASALTLALVFAMVSFGPGAAETLTNDTIVSSVPAAKAGAASAISETAYEVGSVLGTAVLGSLLVSFYQHNIQLPPGLTRTQAYLASETLGGASVVAEQLPTAGGRALLESAHAAFDSGVVTIGIIGAAIMMFAAFLSWKTLRQPAVQH